LRQGLRFRLLPGTIDSRTDTSVQARSSTPLPQFSLSAGPLGAEQVEVTLANIHRAARVRVVGSFPLNATEMAGCPGETDGESDEDGRETVLCAESESHPDCRPPQISRDPTKASELSAQINVPGCTRVSFSLELDADDDANAGDVSFAVLGSVGTLVQLRDVLESATADEPDFVVLLGDIAENATLDGLRDLDFLLRQVDYPTVVLPGEGELVDGARAQFLDTYGPLDFGWEFGGAQFYAFYSAESELGAGGLTRLRSALGRLDPERPALLFTHTPPMDPLGPRDEGFHSSVEAARTLSLITGSSADALFVGHIHDGASQNYHGVAMHLTSVERAGEYLWVRVQDGAVHVDRRAVK
jgi:3',5'-cyclic AMP phosphodiesterase CpdA